jgi:glutamyl-tRNA synthetase
MAIVTRFAPSPTGYLHIGGARTALFNWLYARHTGGTFRLRIEDTDKERSTDDAKRAIVDGLAWLGLDWDGEIVYQLARAARHAEVARALLASGKAYRCWASPEELAAMREAQKKAGQPIRYDGRWRDRDPAEAPAGVAPVIRLKAPQAGDTIIDDLVQGTVRVANAQLDDMVLLRADGTPTYMHAVVVDDHDMGVTHVIRGDDHLTNAFRQRQIFDAMGWTVPRFGHIPLIHGADGAKLSKRHGALGIEAYREMGFLPEAMRNYLLRLGWGHGDADIVSTAEAIALFDVADIGRAPSRFDMAKLTNLNGHYMRAADDARLVADVLPLIEKKLGAAVDATGRARLLAGMAGLKQRARTLVELADQAAFYARPRKLALDAKAAALVAGDGRPRLTALRAALAAAPDWTDAALEALIRAHAEGARLKLGDAAQPLRAALTGSTQSPPIFEVMRILGRDETLGRLDDALG